MNILLNENAKPLYEAHDWVENYKDYEAVLCSVLDINSWSLEATIRAFQTFHWDEIASHDSLTFVHPDTGVSILYDGGAVAIQQAAFGDEVSNDKLRIALGDLFSTLSELGWSRAVVYHPMETMTVFLRDVGSAIPANMNFEVMVPDSLRDVGGFTEAALMKEHGRKLSSVDTEVLEAIQSMGTFGELPVNQNPFAGMSLSDDEVNHKNSTTPYTPKYSFETHGYADDQLPIPQKSASTSVLKTPPETRNASIPALHAENPLAPSLTSVSDNLRQPDPDISLLLEIEGLQAALARAQEDSFAAKEIIAKMSLIENENQRLASTLSSIQKQLIHSEQSRQAITEKHALLQTQLTEARDSLIELPVLLNEKKLLTNQILRLEQSLDTTNANFMESREKLFEFSAIQAEATSAAQLKANPENDVLTVVGESAFCFDTPSKPLSAADISALSEKTNAVDIVHLTPGMAGQAIRWDAMSEFDTDQPWLFERILASHGFEKSMTTPICLEVASLLQKQPYAQLRDLLNSETFLNTPIKELVALSLCTPGRAFVDLRSDSGEDLAPEMMSSFTVKEAARSKEKKLYVVHIDALDGPFVMWLADFLRIVASSYSASRRHLSVEMVEPPAELMPELSKVEIADELHRALGPLMAKLRAMGVSV